VKRTGIPSHKKHSKEREEWNLPGRIYRSQLEDTLLQHGIYHSCKRNEPRWKQNQKKKEITIGWCSRELKINFRPNKWQRGEGDFLNINKAYLRSASLAKWPKRTSKIRRVSIRCSFTAAHVARRDNVKQSEQITLVSHMSQCPHHCMLRMWSLIHHHHHSFPHNQPSIVITIHVSPFHLLQTSLTVIATFNSAIFAVASTPPRCWPPT